ncbi:HU family DNA-binding protein [Salmonella enterica]|nr:HU family DNA-binding protein [Salmonella enterica]EFO7976591.1 HU family DNA-binding protein [Salmonella enterica]EGC0267550.1 HU family DNA-binding protein [Salmonella enterica]
MTKYELIGTLAERNHLTRDKADAFLNDLAELMIDEILTNGVVKIHGIGQLKLVQRAERVGRNPKTREEIVIPASNVLKFSTTKVLKDRLN